MLTQAGISAVPVMNGLDLLGATQLWGAALSSDGSGEMVKGMPYAFARLPFAVRCAAPDLGQDTELILRDVLGLGDADRARLHALGVTRTDV
jgi:crotonobetainyl-CoA:carnitine CoA-transferase CaiB-like acyl-CoA transferase